MEPMSMLGLVHEIKRVEITMQNRSFCFVLGAGASVSSKINSAKEMVRDWIEILYRRKTGDAGAVPDRWATDTTLGIQGFNPKDPASSYSALYRRMYENDPDAGYAYLEDQMKRAEPSFGYSVLGRILADTRHRVVITVNFDNLVADSVSLFSTTYPLVCGHELLAPYVADKLRRPLVLKVHRDLLFGPMSTPDELNSIDAGFREAISRLLKNYTPIVIGYGGNDGSLMGCLEGLPEASIPGGIYWCYRDEPPADRIQKLVARQKGHLVNIMGFDELLMMIGEELMYPVADEYVLERAKERSGRIVKQMQELREKIKKRDEEAQRLSTKATSPEAATTAKEETEAVASAMSSTMRRKGKTKRWWQWAREAEAASDPAERDAIYQKAIEQLPDSPELLGNYANFLTDVRNDHEAAEGMYKRAIEADPKHANNLGNYATFLTDVRKDYEAAEGMFKRAIEADPKHANNLGNYANLLTDVRKDHEAAEGMYKRALEADPKHANNLGNYALFLDDVRKDHEAAEGMYKRALEADPKHANTLGNYATFLTDVRKDYEVAEGMFKRALDADPKRANILGNYATFLKNVRKDYEAAEGMFKRAINSDPKHANNLGNYASFLTDVRKDHEAAEGMFKRAIDADPKRANILGNYATFLKNVRKDYEAAEGMFKRALDADPKHANNLGNYAKFLFDSGRVAEGLKQLDEAFNIFGSGEPSAVNVECWMYGYCVWPAEKQTNALTQLKTLLTQTTIRTGDWDFSGVIRVAKTQKHPQFKWLAKLAEVVAGRADLATLDQWLAWKQATVPDTGTKKA